jgi:hypothetical protein
VTSNNRTVSIGMVRFLFWFGLLTRQIGDPEKVSDPIFTTILLATSL